VTARLRLVSGGILFAYVTTHLLNHALGLISIGAMEEGRRGFLLVWRNPAGTVVLYGALATHIALALAGLYARRSLRMPPWQGLQLGLGLAIPPLLAEHIIGTRILNELYRVEDSYTYVVLVLWLFAPATGLRQVAVLVLAWVHGAMGMHYWLRLKPWYGRTFLVVYGAALLVPVLALLGFVHAGREVAALARDPQWVGETLRALSFPDIDAIVFANTAYRATLGTFVGLLAATLAARSLRYAWERRLGVYHLAYPGGRRVRAVAGMTILETSRVAGIPHASVCGGRGRCSTCRVRLGRGAESVAPPSAEERRVLERIGAPSNVRLACQTRPRRDLEVTPLLPPTVAPDAGFRRPAFLQGSEQEIAVLFADLRAFTEIAESKLPYDVVFLLNRYFEAMGRPVERAGGRVDKFIGDGVMALFGIGASVERGCRDALRAARAMAETLDELNGSLANDLAEPLRIGIGIHAGPAIVGEMGYARATALTAIGDSVNTASRLEALTKTFDCQLVVSHRVEEAAGVDLSAFPAREVDLRGRRERLAVRLVADARALPVPRDPGPRER